MTDPAGPGNSRGPNEPGNPRGPNEPGNPRGPADYDGDHSFVYEYGADLLALLAPERGERVLDLGCGTGKLTAELGERGVAAVGVAASLDMIDRARSNHPGPEFVRSDARSLAFDGAFDAVLSNATLHWISDDGQDAVLESVRNALRADGRFVAELGGAGNVATIIDAVHGELADRGYGTVHPWYFPGVG
jgi:SAM-dependent methyltransferase